MSPSSLHPLSTLSSLAVECQHKKDGGIGSDYVILWYYDMTSRSCRRFWYGGQGGNGNRFESQQECDDMCVHRVVVTSPPTTTTVTAAAEPQHAALSRQPSSDVGSSVLSVTLPPGVGPSVTSPSVSPNVMPSVGSTVAPSASNQKMRQLDSCTKCD